MATTTRKRAPNTSSSSKLAAGAAYGAAPADMATPAPEARASANRGEVQPAARGIKKDILKVLKESLSIDISEGDFTDPNGRTVRVLFDGVCISSASFNVRSRREYLD